MTTQFGLEAVLRSSNELTAWTTKFITRLSVKKIHNISMRRNTSFGKICTPLVALNVL